MALLFRASQGDAASPQHLASRPGFRQLLSEGMQWHFLFASN